MDVQPLRWAFAEFIGDRKFCDFVRHCGTTGRLLYWQEEAWRRFVVARPEWAVSLDELRAALRFCIDHGGDLVAGPVGVWYCPACQREDEAKRARFRAIPSLLYKMSRPQLYPDEGASIPDLVAALRFVERADEIGDKRVVGVSFQRDGMMLIRTGGRVGGNIAALRRTEDGWEIAESTAWCS